MQLVNLWAHPIAGLECFRCTLNKVTTLSRPQKLSDGFDSGPRSTNLLELMRNSASGTSSKNKQTDITGTHRSENDDGSWVSPGCTGTWYMEPLNMIETWS